MKWLIAAGSLAALAGGVLGFYVRSFRDTKAHSSLRAAANDPVALSEQDLQEVSRRVERSLETKRRLYERLQEDKKNINPPVAAEAPPSPEPSANVEQALPPLDELTEEVWKRDRRDDSWARPIEQRFAEHAKTKAADVFIQRMECMSSRCAVALTATNKQVMNEIPNWFGDGKTIFEFKRNGKGKGIDYKAVYLRPGFDIHGNPR